MKAGSAMPEAVWNSTQALNSALASLKNLADAMSSEIASVAQKQSVLKNELARLGEAVRAQTAALKQWEASNSRDAAGSKVPGAVPEPEKPQKPQIVNFEVSLTSGRPQQAEKNQSEKKADRGTEPHIADFEVSLSSGRPQQAVKAETEKKSDTGTGTDEVFLGGL